MREAALVYTPPPEKNFPGGGVQPPDRASCAKHGKGALAYCPLAADFMYPFKHLPAKQRCQWPEGGKVKPPINKRLIKTDRLTPLVEV